MANLTNNNKKHTKRSVVRMMINRKKIYSVADYVRAVNKRTNLNVTVQEIRDCLSHLRMEKQIAFKYTYNRYVCGFCIAA